MKFSRVLLTKITSALALQSEKEVVIKAPWGNITALSWGDPNDPPVILCQGKLDACSSFRPLVTKLPDKFHYVSVDLPGNGRSDHLPRGVRYSVLDLVPTIVRVWEHFKWQRFAFIGHSLGVVIGKYFNHAYPNVISRSVELDPIPAYYNWDLTDLGKWYKRYYGDFYSDERYHKMNGGKESAPKYTYEKIRERMMKARELSREAVEHVLERSLEPTGDGMYRITYDQRMKSVTIPPFSNDYLKQIFVTPNTPTFCILARKSVQDGEFDSVPFIKDPKCWPNNNFRVKIVEGYHDVHVENPGCMADDIAAFLKEDLK